MKSPLIKELVYHAIAKFPNSATKTIAEHLFQKNPAVFSSVEQARSNVRYYRGAKGSGQPKDKTHLRAPQPAGAGTMPALPEGITSFKNWTSLKIDGPADALLISDLHIPYHDKLAVEVAIAKGDGCDLIIVNGDLADCYEVSNFQPDPRKCNFAGALRTAREFFTWLRAKYPKARIVYKEGNHEERLERYFTTRAPAVLGVEEFELKNLLKLSEFGVEWLDEKRPIKLGKLHIIHGHEFKFGSFNPVNPARGLFLRAKTHAIQGHNHQSSQHAERSLTGKTISTWSTGCLCDTRPEYMPLNNWNLGAARVQVDAKGTFHVESFRIIDGVAY
jgi:predicted phosphodiesterase